MKKEIFEGVNPTKRGDLEVAGPAQTGFVQLVLGNSMTGPVKYMVKYVNNHLVFKVCDSSVIWGNFYRANALRIQ